MTKIDGNTTTITSTTAGCCYYHPLLHIDCSNGICIKALLAACWDVITKTTTITSSDGGGDKKDDSDVIRLAEKTSRTFIDRLSTKTKSESNNAIVVVSEVENLYVGIDRIVVQQPRRFTIEGGTVENIGTVCGQYINGSTDFWNSYPLWVAETAKSVLSEISAASSKNQEKQEQEQPNEDCDAHLYLYYLIAILQLFDSMNVRNNNVSYSPLPGRLCKYSTILQKLLSGLIVDPTSFNMGDMMISSPSSRSSTIMSATFGMALLRVLSSSSSSGCTDIVVGRSGQQQPRSVSTFRRDGSNNGIMVMEKFGLGTNSLDLQVSIFWGKAQQQQQQQHVQGPNTTLDAVQGDPHHSILFPIDADSMPISPSATANKNYSNNDVDNNDINGDSGTVGDHVSSTTTTATTTASLWNIDSVTQLEANMDDITGEQLAFVIERLMMGQNKSCCYDAWVTPIVMKKGRPAYTLHCLCKDDTLVVNDTIELIFRHTSTLGVRIWNNIPRATLDRSIVSVSTPYLESKRNGMVDVKISQFKSTGEILSKKAEYEHCKEISLDTGVPIKWIADDATRRATSGG
jgi:hypothetical protein